MDCYWLIFLTSPNGRSDDIRRGPMPRVCMYALGTFVAESGTLGYAVTA